MRRKRKRNWLAMALGLVFGTGCGSGEISRQEFRDRVEELQADMLAGGGGEVVRKGRELAARPPDRPLRDSAAALVSEIDELFGAIIGLRLEIKTLTVSESEDDGWPPGSSLTKWFGRSQVQAAALALERAAQRRDGSWQEIRGELEAATIEAVDKGMRRGTREKQQLERWLEADGQTLAQRQSVADERERERAPTAAVAVPPPQPPPSRPTVTEHAETEPVTPNPAPTLEEDPPAAPPDPEAVRDSVKAEVAALGPLHDDLIEVLEEIHKALTDPEEKRQARDRVRMAEIAKRQDMKRLKADVNADPEWRVSGARRAAARAKTSLERDIAEARKTLAKIGGV